MISDDELARLATVESLVERRTLAIDDSSITPGGHVIRANGHAYSDQPPALAVALAGPYWVMKHLFDLTFDNNPSLVAYLLTLIGVTIPVAAGAGLIYRMGRLFELPRKRRTLLALAVAFGSGLVSYAVVLNPHAPAAALLLGSAACVIHVSIAKRPGVTSGWLAVAGFCAVLAATIDPATIPLLIFFALAIPAMRWRWPMRAGGLVLYAMGAAGPLLLHGALVKPITGDFLPPAWHRELAVAPGTVNLGDLAVLASSTSNPTTDESVTAAVEDFAAQPASWWTTLGRRLGRLAAAMVGEHGLFSHFPVLILAFFGVAAVMHRHWPATTKWLAGATVATGAALLIATSVLTTRGAGSMFGPQVFVALLPLTLFWAGAWMRRKHGVVKWSLAAVLLLFSITVTILGATDPYPRGGYDRYTPVEAVVKLAKPQTIQTPPILAGR